MKLTSIALGLAGASAVCAQVSGFPAPEVGNLTATAILGWYAWHTASKTIPGLVRDFRQEMAAERAESRAERELFAEQLTAERRQRHEDHQAVVEAVRDLADRLVA
ncbi:MAG: hypothetical protein ACYC0Y_01115 [Pirellulales bacterium]